MSLRAEPYPRVAPLIPRSLPANTVQRLKRKKLTRRRKSKIADKGLSKRIAELMELTALDYTPRQSIKRSRDPGWKESSAKNELADFAHRKVHPASPKTLPRSYSRGQPCIDKLLLVCFCLGVPAQKVSAVVAPLLTKRIVATNIAQVATNLDRELAGYQRRLDAAKRRRASGTVMTNRDLKNPYPTTMRELEEELDALLTSLRDVEPDLWNRLETAGLLKQTLRR